MLPRMWLLICSIACASNLLQPLSTTNVLMRRTSASANYLLLGSSLRHQVGSGAVK